jgi:integrating conjugative element protein (TIGR03765 family)
MDSPGRPHRLWRAAGQGAGRRVAAALLSAALVIAGPSSRGQGVVATPAASLEVVHDSGRGVPLAPYLSAITSSDPAARGSVMPGLRFPISTKLSTGVLPQERRVFDATWQVQPIFIVGADVRSMRWLAFNRDRLLREHAWGVVVQARTEAEFRAIQAVAPQLAYAPSMGSWMDDQLLASGVVYPVFIDAAGNARQILIGSGESSGLEGRTEQPPEVRP